MPRLSVSSPVSFVIPSLRLYYTAHRYACPYELSCDFAAKSKALKYPDFTTGRFLTQTTLVILLLLMTVRVRIVLNGNGYRSNYVFAFVLFKFRAAHPCHRVSGSVR